MVMAPNHCALLGAAFLFACVITHAQSFSRVDEFEQAPQLVVEHELIKGKFTKRGTVGVQFAGNGAAFYQDEGSLSDEQLRSLLSLADNSDVYRIRVLTKAAQKADYVYGFVYACDLVHSGLRDNLTLAVNSNGGLVGVHLGLRDSAIARYEACRLTDGQRDLASLPRAFSTRAALLRPVPGPVPETQLYVTRMEEEKKRKQEAEHGDNRSFIAKYWMYIVPAVLIFMVASNADPNAQGGGGGS